MQLLFAGGVSNAVLQAICRTLIHSLWQGLIAAVIAALIVTFTKRSAASVRYNLLFGVLVLFVLGIIITAGVQWQHGSSGNDHARVATTITHSLPAANFETGEEMVKGEAAGRNLTERFSTYCNDHASIIVLIWFLLFLIKCSQLLASARYMHRIRRGNHYEASLYWKERLSDLAQKTGVSRAITFLESELIKIPAVIGYFKPVLLVPAGLLANLPPEQVEAILLHELAHIRRRDFLANLLQSVIETFFFFNPAIIWISSLIREEREACCDDMVIAHIPQKASYLHALVSFQELQLYPKAGAIALTGHKHYLFNRVKRMLTLENKKLNLMEKTVLILSIVGITAFGFITKESVENPVAVKLIKNEILHPISKQPQATVPVITAKKPIVKQKRMAVAAPVQLDADTLPKTKEERSFPSISSSSKSDGKSSESQVDATDNEGKHYSIKRADGQITSLIIDGTVIPQDQYGAYSEVISQIDEAQRQHILKRKEDLELRKADLLVKQKQMLEKRKELTVANRKELNQKIELRKEMQIENKLKRDEASKLFDKKNELWKSGFDKRNELWKLAYDQKKAEILQNQKLYNQKKVEMLQNQKLYNQNKAEIMQSEKLYNQKKIQSMQSAQLFKQGRTGNDDIGRIISDLSHQNLVSDADDLSFTLTEKELVVNGKKQPAEIHQQFKEKYIQKSRDKFKYSKKGNATSITINKD